MDSDLMTKLGLLVAFVALGLGAKVGLHKYQVSRINSQGKTLALKFIDEQKKHYDQHREYIYDLQKVQNLNKIEPSLSVYHADYVVPEHYQPILQTVGAPFLTRDDYRIYVEVKNPHDKKVYFWVVNPNDKPALLVTDISIDSQLPLDSEL